MGKKIYHINILYCDIFLLTFVIIMLISFANFSNGFAISKVHNFNQNIQNLDLSSDSYPVHPIKKISSIEAKPNNITTLPLENKTLSFCKNNLTDDFSSPYNLEEDQISPNGKWQNVYSGYGSTGVEPTDKNNVFFLKPVATKSINETEAALVKSTDSFCNFEVNVDVKTVKQLRENNPPNDWEAAWFIFRYTDIFHYFWFVLTPNGFELGKKDCDTCTDPFDGQQSLATGHTTSMQLNTWSHWKINAIGNHIQVFVDGKLVIDYIDNKMDPKLFCGNIAMYSEDAYVQYDNVQLKSQ
jgi:hypothetical protein